MLRVKDLNQVLTDKSLSLSILTKQLPFTTSTSDKQELLEVLSKKLQLISGR